MLRLLAVSALALTLIIACTPQGQAGFQTALFVSQMLDFPVKPQTWFTDEPVRYKGIFSSPDGRDLGDVYLLPDGKTRAAVVLSIGASPEGLDDPNVVNLGRALARGGLVTMFHWSPKVGKEARLDPSEPERLVRAFQYLIEQDYADTERVGLGGFCVGASFALVAAADPRIRADVDFVNAFGPFFDTEQLMLEVASRSAIYDGVRTAWQPESFTLRVLANELIRAVDNPSDRRILTRRYIDGRPRRISDMEALTPLGKTVAHLLDGANPGDAMALYEMLPLEFREAMAEISPSTYVGDIRARILLMHDRNDPLIPAAESRRLVESGHELNVVRYTEFQAFDHVEPEGGGLLTRLGQGFRLYLHMYEVMRITA